MGEAKTALGRMGVYYLLLAVNIIPCANVIADAFPTRNVSTVYLLVLAVCLVLYYAHRAMPTGELSAMMRSISWMGLLLILLRGVKYSAFPEVGVLARHTWYLYYVPMLLLPLFLLRISLLVSPGGTARETRAVSCLALAVTAALIVGVLTNDLHMQAFAFRPGFADWDGDYANGWLSYAAFAWQYALYIAAIGMLTVKCRIGSAKKSAWVILIPFAIGVVINVLLITDRMPKLNGTNLVEFPEALFFTDAAVLECCMQLGLIPTNTDYGRLFRNLSLSAQITDRSGAPVYSSYSAAPLTPEQRRLPGGARIGEHTVLNRMEIPGGFGFWQEDLTELDRLNNELAETKEALAQEAELFRLRNELKERRTKIEQRTLVYDTVARRTQQQSQRISRLAEAARTSADPRVKERNRRRIVLLAAYIKRYANLMLLAQEQSVIEAGELGLSVSEVLRCLNLCGVPGEFIGTADCALSAEAALRAFEIFETLLEDNDGCLAGVFVNLSARDRAYFKMTIENRAAPLPPLSGAGIAAEVQEEDGVTYICLALPKGGDG